MGEHMALTAKEWGISREAQDELTLRSHQRLAVAYENGFFDDLVTPYLGVTRDDDPAAGHLAGEARVAAAGLRRG